MGIKGLKTVHFLYLRAFEVFLQLTRYINYLLTYWTSQCSDTLSVRLFTLVQLRVQAQEPTAVRLSFVQFVL